jgi:drug/metabolite transporter (DMT)-like permease
MPAQRSIRLGLAIIASAGSLALSWPFWRDFSYWAESPAMWLIYFAVGFVLAVYVFVAFFRSLRTLFEHDALTRGGDDGEARP